MSNTKERLFIRKIEIENVGRFYGAGHSITLSDSSDKNITIIIGYSGRGKSTIHDLIYWCLYGKHKDHTTEERKSLDYGFINIDALKNLSRGESVTAKVILSLHNDQGEKYRLTRELTATLEKESNKKIFNEHNNSKVSEGITFSMYSSLMHKDAKEEMQNETNSILINNEINKYFPKDLADFFLFDGENLIKFQNQTSSGFIRDGITKISGLGILDLLSEHAKITATNIRKHIGSKNIESTPYVERDKRLDEQIKQTENEISKYKMEEEKYHRLYDQVSEQIRQTKEGKRLIDEQKKAESNKKREAKNLRDVEDEIRDFLFDKIPQLLILDTLKKSEEIFSRLEDEDKIPPSITRDAIDKILNSNPLRCVCGREFEKDENDKNGPWVTLSQIKGSIIEDNLSQGISLGRNLITRIIDDSNSNRLKNDYNDMISKRRETRREIESLKGHIESLEREIRTHDSHTGEDLSSLKKEYYEKMTENGIYVKQNDSKLEDLYSQHDKNKRELEDSVQKEGKYENEMKKITMAEHVATLSKKLKKRVEEKLRTETEYTTSKYFLESAPQKEDFANVTISSNYDIIAKDSDDDATHLSKGQAHVLGLSYVAGIREITGTNTFLIIDSPLHNISGDARNDISEVFSKYLPGVQLVLLVTDTEYLHGDEDGAEPVRSILRNNNRVWKEYFIDETKTKDGIKSRRIREYIK